MRRYFFSFEQKIMLTFSGILLLALTLFALLNYYNTATTVSQIVEQNMNQNLSAARLQMGRYVEELENITLAPTYSPQIKSVLKSLKNRPETQRQEAESVLFEAFELLIGLRKDLLGVYLFDDNHNKYYKTALGDITPLYSFYSSPWYQQVLTTEGEPLLIGTHKTDYFVTVYPKYAISMARSIMDTETGEFVGIIYVDMDLKVLKEIATGISQFGDSQFYIVDEQNNIFYSEDDQLLGKSFNTFDTRIMKDTQGNQRLKIDGRNSLVSYQKSQENGWHYIVISDLDVLVASYMQNTGAIIIAMTIILLLVTVIISALISIRISKPIMNLASAMEQTDGLTFKLAEGRNSSHEIHVLVETYNDMAIRIDQLIKDTYMAELQAKEARFAALQSQMNPHFFYNTLNSISSIAQVKGVEEISEICGSMAGLYRYSAESDNRFVPLEEELRCVRQYMQIQKVRYGDKITYSMDIAPEAEAAKIIKLSVQPIVENAIYHGLEPKKGSGEIRIKAEIVGEDICISVYDNGVGFDDKTLRLLQQSLEKDRINKSTDKSVSNIGMINVHERLRLNFGSKYGLVVTSKKGEGCCVSMNMPYQKGVV